MAFDDLRDRSIRLRGHSRELIARSRDCRRRLQAAVEGVTEARVGSSAAVGDVGRLLRAESDLETAISECTAALGAIRRELGWRDDGNANPTVH